MADIEIAGASFLDVPAVDFPKSGGGLARFYDRSGELDWMGIEAELVNQVYSAEYDLTETTFPSWTPSTTAKAVVASKTAGTFVADMVNYEYLLKWEFRADIVYNDGTTLKVAPETECAVLYQAIYRRPSSIANIESENFNNNACITYFTAPLLIYYNSSGAKTFTWSASYGFYPGATAATFSSATANAPTVTIKTPTLNARCSTTYFSTSMAGNVDQANSKLSIVGTLYRVKKGSAIRAMYGSLVDLFNS